MNDPYDLIVLGGGPGGYAAAFRGADLGLRTALIEREAQLGGVCLNVGCIPSKTLLHVAAIKEEAEALAAHGVAFAPAKIDLAKLRTHVGGVVRRLTGGLADLAKKRGVTVIAGEGTFTGRSEIAVKAAGATQTLTFRSCIIAVGSRPAKLDVFPDDPRIVDSTGALALPSIPKRMLVVGGGVIGLEMATIYSALGARIDVVEAGPRLLTGVDADLVAIWRKANAPRLDHVWLDTQVAAAEARKDGVHVRFAGKAAGEGVYDLVLVAAGRIANGDRIGLEAAGLDHTRGVIAVDAQRRTARPDIFAVGDVTGAPMLAHKATHEGHVAAEVIAGKKAAFDARVIPGVAYTAPEIAWVGETEEGARAAGRAVRVARFPWAASGRALASNATAGVTKLIFDQETDRVIGAGIVGAHAGDLIGEAGLAIEMGADRLDIAHTIHAHPTLGETIGLTAEVALGTCTDLPRQSA
ncbi:MAG: dihydrolipoyl dehydrogenase [Alphaproteobacteria bacterium]|nr:dihydrolipoyl dehydrogenase [Alphaproteobacteria bacterium]